MAIPEFVGPCRETRCQKAEAFMRYPYCAQSFCFEHFLLVYHAVSCMLIYAYVSSADHSCIIVLNILLIALRLKTG